MSSPSYSQADLFISGREGYHTYRIPALAVSTRGRLLAFCEGRKYSRSDSGKIDLLLRRSLDGGRSWAPVQLVVADGERMTCGNPCPVVDRRDGTIWLLFCKNLADGPEDLIIQGKAPRTVWITRSPDDGETWSDPVEITPDVKRPSWTWYATGPGHGIQLADGRLVVPCDHMVGRNYNREDPYHAHVILRDDRGSRWRIGGIAAEGTNECAVVETADGALYLNCRNYRGEKRRAFARSYDRGETFTEFGWDEALVEPICQGSLVRLPKSSPHGEDRVLFANPASTSRERMTVRMSDDECRTWPVSRLLHEGPAAYSDLVATPDGTICCLYERGEQGPYERITLVRFNEAWLLGDGRS